MFKSEKDTDKRLWNVFNQKENTWLFYGKSFNVHYYFSIYNKCYF